MKKKICIAGIILMMAVVTGCSKPEDSNKQKKDQEQEQDVKKESDNAEEKAEPYIPGTIDGNHYESQWIGIRIDLPEDYIMATQEELAGFVEQGTQFIDEDAGDRVNEAMENGQLNYEMMTSTATGDPNLNIGVEKLPLKNITTEQFVKQNKDIVEQSTTNGVTTQYQDEITDMVIGGQDYKCMSGIMTIQTENGSAQLNSDIYVRVKDGYAIVITVTSSQDTQAQKDELLAAVQPY